MLFPPTPELTVQMPFKKERAKVIEVCIVGGGLLSLVNAPDLPVELNALGCVGSFGLFKGPGYFTMVTNPVDTEAVPSL